MLQQSTTLGQAVLVSDTSSATCKHRGKIWLLHWQRNLRFSSAILAFSDRSAPTGFGLLQSFSIIGLYTGFVMIMNRLFREKLFNQIQNIKYTEMPCSMRIWNLLLEIQLVQQAAQNKEPTSAAASAVTDSCNDCAKSELSEAETFASDKTVHDDKWDCYLELEEELAAKLIYLYRDPVTMIEWTMPPKRKRE